MENALRVFERGAVADLAAKHVRASCLKWHGKHESWLVEFEYHCQADYAKLAALKFLETCYYATEVTFWKKSDVDEPNMFYALFVMGDISLEGYNIV